MHNTERFLRALIALTVLASSAALWWPASAHAARIKEVATVQGVRSNPLVGYGLVVGLDGTGDQTTSTPFTTQSINAMLQQMGVTVPPGTNMQLKNVAAVMVTAQLPPFAQPGAGDRRQRVLARQCQEPARWHADRHFRSRARTVRCMPWHRATSSSAVPGPRPAVPRCRSIT